MNNADLIAYNRRWVRLHRDDPYQREAARRITALCDALEADTIIHRCPVEGAGLTPCCGRTPFELPEDDRLTIDPSQVTCRICTESEES